MRKEEGLFSQSFLFFVDVIIDFNTILLRVPS